MGVATAPLDGNLFPAQAFVSCDSLQDYSSAIPPGVSPVAHPHQVLAEWHVRVRPVVHTVPGRFAPLHLEIQVRRTIGLHKSPCPYRQNAYPLPPSPALLSPVPTPAPLHPAAPAFRSASSEAKARRFRWLL